MSKMRRACHVTLKYITQSKRRKICRLLGEYRYAVNFFILSLWEKPGKLDKKTLSRLGNTRLSARYKSQALKQALELVVSTKKAAKSAKRFSHAPVFRGAAVLDAKFVSVEEGEGSFDLVVRLSTLQKGARVTLPTKRTAVLNKWCAHKGAVLVQGCAISENKMILWVALPDYDYKEKGKVIGVDIGINKLIVTDKGQRLGRDFKVLRDKIKRKRPGSKARARSHRERTNYINQKVNKLPWCLIKMIGVEDLKKSQERKK